MKVHLLIPEDVPEPQLVLHGRRELLIEEYQELLLFDEDQIRLRFSERVLVIRGRHLLLCAMSPTGATVRGEIDSLVFEEERECSD